MKKLIYLLLVLIFVLPSVCWGEEDESAFSNQQDQDFFTAKVLQVVEEREIEREDGSKVIQQNLKLKGIDGSWKNKEFNYFGIGELDVISGNIYQEGDKVHVLYSPDFEGKDVFYITDYVRQNYLIWLVLILCLAVIGVAYWKGVKALLSLLLTFIIIIWFIIPRILAGMNPLFITIIACLIIAFVIVYLTEGFNRGSHIAVVSIVISLFLTGVLTIIFTKLGRLTGSASEEIMYLVGAGEGVINFQGLLLAGIMIGTLGALDDGVISQVATVSELRKANPGMRTKDLFKSAMKVGTSHIGSMTNTLFLAYAGASLPLLLIFSVRQEPFISFSQIINNEMIATEIVRAFVGSIGLALAIPIATWMAVRFVKNGEWRMKNEESDSS